MKIFKGVLLILILVFLGSRFSYDLKSYPFHEDEHGFISRAPYFDLFFLKRDFLNTAWEEDATYDQPPVAYYFYGLTLHLIGYGDLATKAKEIGFNNAHLDMNVLGWPAEKFNLIEPWWIRFEGKEIAKLPLTITPVLKMISQARITAVIFSLGCLFLIYLLGSQIGGFATGIFSTLILGFNSLVLMTSRWVMADPILIFFLLANVLLIIYAFKFFYREIFSRFLFFSFLIGINAALAAGTKLNGAMALIIYDLLIFLALIFLLKTNKRKDKQLWVLINGCLISMLTALAFFILLNPYLYKNPFLRPIKMFNHRVVVSQWQQTIQPENALLTFSDKIKAVFKQTLTKEGEWNNFNVAFLDLIFFGSGIIWLGRIAFKKFVKDKNISPQGIVLAWVLLTFLSVILYIPLNWARYYLPIIPAIAIAQAYAIIKSLDFGFKKVLNMVKK